MFGGAPEQAASQRRDVAGSKLDALSQAPSPGPSPPAPQPPSPSPKVKTVFYELLMQRKVKMVFSEHVMCALFCVPLRSGKTLVVTMGSHAAYTARAAPPTKAPTKGPYLIYYLF